MNSSLSVESSFDIIDSSSKPDLRGIRYVDCTEHLHCPICKQPFIKPMTTVCGHTFCQECIDECLTMSNTQSFNEGFCPLDRTPLLRQNTHDIFPTPLIITNMVDELMVICHNSERGCEWKGRRWELESHLFHECGHTGVVCNGILSGSPDTYDGSLDAENAKAEVRCTKIVQRRFITDNDVCVHEVFPCGHCSTEIDKVTEEYHLESECELNFTTCDLCNNDLIPKKLLEKHKTNCLKTGVLVCPARKIGCTWIGHNQPSLENHTAKGSCSLFQMMPYFETLEKKVEVMSSENKYLKESINKVLDSVILGRVTNLGYSEPMEEIGNFNTDDGKEACLRLRCDFERHKLVVEEKLIPFIERERSAMLERENRVNSLMNDSFVIKDELNLQRALANSLRKQVQFLLFQRRSSLQSSGSEEIYTELLSRSSSEERINLKL